MFLQDHHQRGMTFVRTILTSVAFLYNVPDLKIMAPDDHWIKSLMLNLLSRSGIVRKSETFRSLCSHALSILGESSKPKNCEVVHEQKSV